MVPRREEEPERGDRVEPGSPIAEVHARDEESAERAVDEVTAAYSIVEQEPERRPIVLEVLS